MSEINMLRRAFLGALVSAGSVAGVQRLFGEEPLPRTGLKEPVERVAKKNNVGGGVVGKAPAANAHPLDAALEVAHNSLEHIQKDVTDYTAFLLKRERINGTLYDQETMFTKIRSRKVVNGQITTPLSVYMYFKKPDNFAGREVMFVEGKNNGKMWVHEAGVLGKMTGTVSLDPKGMLAMKGNRYPIMEVGIENLIVKLIEKGERERKFDECSVEFREGAAINKRKCTVIEVVHPVRRPHFEFNLAQVFIDDELNVPLRYAAYSWPSGVDSNPKPTPSVDNVIEEFTYLNLELNVGLKDNDFDIENPNYGFKGARAAANNAGGEAKERGGLFRRSGN